MTEVETTFLIIATIISLGFLSNYLFSLTRIPDAVWLLVAGLLIGPVAKIYGYEIASEQILLDILPFFLVVAIVMILFEGGLGFNLNKIFRQIPEYFTMTIVTLVLSASSTIGAIYLYSNLVGNEFNLMSSLILGIIIGGTTSAMVSKKLSSFRHADEKTTMMLGLESIISSPLIIMLTLAVMPLVGAELSSFSTIITDIFYSYAISAIVGIIAGVIWIKIMSIIKNQEYHYMLTLAFIFAMYIFSARIEANGYVMAFALGVILCNSKRLMRLLKVKSTTDLTAEMKKFNSLISFFIKTFFLIFLGTLVTFGTPSLFSLGFGISLALLGVRYISVRIFAPIMKIEKRDRKIINYVYPRGLTPAVLAVMLYMSDVPSSSMLVNITFAVIITTVILSTIGTFVVDRKH